MPDDLKIFTDFGVEEDLALALSEAGITTPFPIQELTLPLALGGSDLIGQARTGTGKTLAFGLPLLQRVPPSSDRPRALVVVPTRELCLQVHDDLRAAGKHKGSRVVAVYGGRSIDSQSEAIAAGASAIVGTPGRLLDLRRRGLLDLSAVTVLVLDEADEMLDMGFLPDVEQLIEACADQRQTMLFSATMPSEVVALARRWMHKPTFMRADVEEPRIARETRQFFLSCHRMDKPAVLARILQSPERGSCLVFTRTKRMADVLVEDLRERGIKASAIHSDLRQETRERTLARFRQGKVDVVCATEVAARGLDIDEVTHVVNYDCPDDEKMYLHRIGRTGRAGAEGVAITLVVWNELARLEMIKKALNIDIETHEVFSTSPILDELFGLPPRDARPPIQIRPEPSADRRRPRQRERRRADVAAADEPTPSRTRVRRRQRDSDRPVTGAQQEAARAKPPAAEGEEPVRTRVRRRERGSTGSPVAEDAPKGTARRDRSRTRQARDTKVPGPTGGGGKRRPRQRSQPKPAEQRPRKSAHTDAQRARHTAVSGPRGSGRPALRRPLLITHLP